MAMRVALITIAAGLGFPEFHSREGPTPDEKQKHEDLMEELKLQDLGRKASERRYLANLEPQDQRSDAEASPLEKYVHNFEAHEKAAKDLLAADVHHTHPILPQLSEAVAGLHEKLQAALHDVPADPAAGAKPGAYHALSQALGLTPPAMSDEDMGQRAKVLAGAVGHAIGDTVHMSSARTTLSALETEVLQKLAMSVRMMVQLHYVMQPIRGNLREAMATMPPAAKLKAQEVLGHIDALDSLSGKAVDLAKRVETAKTGDEHAQRDAIAAMIEGMQQVKDGVKLHLGALREPAPHPKTLTAKLRAMVERTAARLAREKADPAKNGDPIVALDTEMFETLKQAASKSQALINVAGHALKQCENEEQKRAVKEFTKAGMRSLLGEMKTSLSTLKMKAVSLSIAKLNKKFAKTESKPVDAPAVSPQKAPTDADVDDEEDIEDGTPGARVPVSTKKVQTDGDGDGDDDSADGAAPPIPDEPVPHIADDDHPPPVGGESETEQQQSPKVDDDDPVGDQDPTTPSGHGADELRRSRPPVAPIQPGNGPLRKLQDAMKALQELKPAQEDTARTAAENGKEDRYLNMFQHKKDWTDDGPSSWAQISEKMHSLKDELNEKVEEIKHPGHLREQGITKH